MVEQDAETGKYCLGPTLLQLGDAGIAALVFDNRGEVVGAIGVTGPVERLLPTSGSPPAAQLVREAARALSRELVQPAACRHGRVSTKRYAPAGAR